MEKWNAYRIITLSIVLVMVLITLAALVYNVNYNDCKLYAKSLDIGFEYSFIDGCNYKIDWGDEK